MKGTSCSLSRAGKCDRALFLAKQFLKVINKQATILIWLTRKKS